jgi:hypothetical protein
MSIAPGGPRLPGSARRRWHRLLTLLAAAMAVLSSGGCMVGAGYLMYAHGWRASGLAMTAGGALIFTAFTLTPRGRLDARSPQTGVRTHARGRGGAVRLPWKPRVGLMAITLAAGAAMVLAGYAALAWSSVLLIPLVLLGGLAILAAFVLLAKY